MIFQTGGSRCKTGFSDLQNVATNCCFVQRTAAKFRKDTLYHGTVPLTVENLNNSIKKARTIMYEQGL
jgi:hypothetical protein